MDPVLALADADLTADPGGQARTKVTVRNVGQIVAQYRLEVLGEAAAWSTIVPQHVSVLPGEAEERTVDVVFSPPPAPAAPVGTVPFGVRCVSMENRDVAAVVEGDVHVSPVQDLDVRLRPEGARGARAGRYRIELRNTGTQDLTVAVAVSDAAGLLRFVLAPREVTVGAGRLATVYLAAAPRTPRLLGKPIQHSFTVTYRVSGSTRSGELPVTYEQRPVVRKNVVVLAVLLVLLLAAGYLWLRSLGGQVDLVEGAPPPVLLEQVEAGPGSVRLVWTRSAYATGYEIQQMSPDDDVTDAADVEEQDRTSFTWAEREPGTHCYRLRATTESTRGPFTEPACVEVLAPEPTPSPTVEPTVEPTPAETEGPDGPSGADFEPEAFYVLWGNFPLNDPASPEAAIELAAALQGAGAQGVQVKDSRWSDTFADGANDVGNTVVFTDGFATEAQALAECSTYQAVAELCIAQGSPP